MIITIFLISIATAFLVPTYRAWEIRTRGAETTLDSAPYTENFSFRNIEKVVLYLTKNFIVLVVLGVAKYWFIAVTKSKKWLEENMPKVLNVFKRKEVQEDGLTKNYSFTRRLILELRAKLRRTREAIRREHE
jgi:hypothetical protein